MHWKVAGILLAATAGTAMTTGREVVLFFSQLGAASWLATGLASLGFGAMCAGLCALTRKTGGQSIASVLIRSAGQRIGWAAAVLHGVMTLVVAVMMLMRCGHLAALVLPLRNAFWIGVLSALMGAILLNLTSIRLLTVVSWVALTATGVFLAALLLDGREIAYVQKYEVFPTLEGSIPAALTLGTLHAALNVCTAAGTVVWIAEECVSISQLCVYSGAGMAAVLALANGAILRGGKRLLSQAAPLVLLAARWGTLGFWMAAAVQAACTILTLAAAVRSLGWKR